MLPALFPFSLRINPSAGRSSRGGSAGNAKSNSGVVSLAASQRHHDPRRGPPELLPAPAAALPPPLPAGPGGQGQPWSVRSLLPAGSAAALRREPDLEPEAAQGPAEPPGCGSGTRQCLPNASAAPQPLPGEEETPKTSPWTPKPRFDLPAELWESQGAFVSLPSPSASAPWSFLPSTT